MLLDCQSLWDKVCYKAKNYARLKNALNMFWKPAAPLTESIVLPVKIIMIENKLKCGTLYNTKW